MYIYIYIYIYTVSFHNFKSQNFKLSVSNPKNKYVAYLSVLSQISNCQSPGRKNKHVFLKTDRSIFITITSINNSNTTVIVIAILQGVQGARRPYIYIYDV